MGPISKSLVVAIGVAACEPAPRDISHAKLRAPALSVEVEVKEASARPAALAAAASSSPPSRAPAPEQARVEALEVPGDRQAWIVRGGGDDLPRIVFLPGVCSNAGAYLMGFPEAARAFGGVVAIEGDRPCGDSKQFHSITSDPSHEEPRILAALAAAGWGEKEPKEIVLVGYSLGATLIENLVRRRPDRYPRVALIGSPRDPRLDRLKGARSVASMSCSLDVPARMQGVSRTLAPAGVSVRYFEMPGCTHGNLADAERTMTDAFGFLTGER